MSEEIIWFHCLKTISHSPYICSLYYRAAEFVFYTCIDNDAELLVCGSETKQEDAQDGSDGGSCRADDDSLSDDEVSTLRR